MREGDDGVLPAQWSMGSYRAASVSGLRTEAVANTGPRSISEVGATGARVVTGAGGAGAGGTEAGGAEAGSA